MDAGDGGRGGLVNMDLSCGLALVRRLAIFPRQPTTEGCTKDNCWLVRANTPEIRSRTVVEEHDLGCASNLLQQLLGFGIVLSPDLLVVFERLVLCVRDAKLEAMLV